MGNTQEKITLPEGTWQHTSIDVNFNEDTGLLKCKLLTKEKVEIETSTIVRNGMVLENNNGHFEVLDVGNKSDTEPSNLFPTGTWMMTAKESTILANGVLKSNLKKKDGRYIESLVVVHKGMALENDDGTFKYISEKNQSVSNTTPELETTKNTRKEPVYKIIGGNWYKTARVFPL